MRHALSTCSLCGVVLSALAPALMGQSPPRSPPTADRVLVPGGAFLMGSDGRGEADEHPRFSLTVPSFRVDRTEVSRANYLACAAAGVCAAPQDYGDRFHDPAQPVVGVSWPQAARYCAWTAGRLPTEREWEKAARGTDGRTYPWGEDAPTPDRAVFGRGAHTGSPDPVGRRPRGASPCGALDMAGNVWEWTATPYDPYAYRHPEPEPTCETALASLEALRRAGVQGFTGTNPLPAGCERALRGGAWNYGALGLRSSNRVHHPPGWRIVVAGFRCVASP